jgi:hypothetical protein
MVSLLRLMLSFLLEMLEFFDEKFSLTAIRVEGFGAMNVRGKC